MFEDHIGPENVPQAIAGNDHSVAHAFVIQFDHLDVGSLRHTQLVRHLIADGSAHREAGAFLTSCIDPHNVGFPRHPRGARFLSADLPLVLGYPSLLLGGIRLVLSRQDRDVCTALRLTGTYVFIGACGLAALRLFYVPYQDSFGVTNIGTVELITLDNYHSQCGARVMRVDL